MLVEQQAPAKSRSSLSKYLWVCGMVVVGLAAAFLAVAHWPFTRSSIIHALEGSSAQTVRIEAFKRTYFPPGCIAEGVRFLHNEEPVITIERLAIRGSYFGVFLKPKRIAEVRVSGMRVTVPPKAHGSHPHPEIPLNAGPGGEAVAISRIIVDGASLEFLSDAPGEKAFRMGIRNLIVSEIGSGNPMFYRAVLENSLPPGVIHSEGKIGPWLPQDPGSVAATGSFRYTGVKLGVFHGISGRLEARGEFRGVLGRIETDGETEVKEFQVEGGQPVHLTTAFHATVNGLNGDTLLRPVTARFRRTTLDIRGPIAGRRGQSGKTATFDVAIRGGHIDDLMHLFGSDPRPPMRGDLNLQAKVIWPPGKEKFLRKIGMEIDFAIAHATFASPRTQASLNRLSASAKEESDNREKETPIVESELKGHVSVERGVGTFSPLTFAFPGSTASMAGQYSLLAKTVNVHGTLYTSGKLAAATSGAKSVFLKAITPIFKKKNSIRTVPFRIAGPSRDATVSLDLRR